MVIRTEQLERVDLPDSNIESQGPFSRVFVQRDALLCLPSAIFDNVASEARDHCGR
jgi:hypothetical protein